MFRLWKILNSDTYNSVEVSLYLDSHLHPELFLEKPGVININGKDLNEDESQKYWATDFLKRMPRIKRERLRYICTASGQYWNKNLTGKVCQKYIWPAFFKSFPKGRILIIKLNDDWLNAIWSGQFTHSASVEFKKDNPFFHNPQEMSGLQSDLLPLNALNIASCGFYPLILFDHIHIFGNLFLVYVPDKRFTHSQMTEGGAYEHILWRIHHILDDQWTFDGSRGPKSKVFSNRLSPIRNIKFIEWVIEKLNDRMVDLVRISDHIRCEQIAMTFNRAVCDSILSVSTQLPYMSKVFLFSCIDKLANLYAQIDDQKRSETELWKRLLDKGFLEDELIEFLRNIPNPVGDVLSNLIIWVSEEMEFSKLNSMILKGYRNTIHGYMLRPKIVEQIYRHSGELNNDITLVSTPLALYFLAKKWQ